RNGITGRFSEALPGPARLSELRSMDYGEDDEERQGQHRGRQPMLQGEKGIFIQLLKAPGTQLRQRCSAWQRGCKRRCGDVVRRSSSSSVKGGCRRQHGKTQRTPFRHVSADNSTAAEFTFTVASGKNTGAVVAALRGPPAWSSPRQSSARGESGARTRSPR